MTSGTTVPAPLPAPPAAGRPSRPALPRRLGWALGSGTILQGLNSAIVAVALVPIARDLGASAAIPWIVSGLYIAAAVGSPTGGRLADLYGPRRVYLAGLVIVLAASLVGPFLTTVEALVWVRVLLGLGTSLQFPAAMAIIRKQAAKRDANPVGAIGVVALCGQTTAAIGPTIGGLVVAVADWPGIFWVNLPVVLNAALWVWFVVPRDERRPRRGPRAALRAIDPAGLTLFVATLVLLMTWLLSLRSSPAWWMLGALVPVVALLVWRELRAAEPFLDLRLLARHRQLTATCVRAIATFTSFYCIFYGIPQWLQQSRGLDAATAGLLMFPVFGVGVVSTLLATRAGRRMRPRVMLAIGTGAMVLGGAVLALSATTDAPLWLLAVANGLLGVPNGFNNLGNQLLVHDVVPEGAAGAATGLYRTAQYVGASLSAVIVAHGVSVLEPEGGITVLGFWIGGLGLVLSVLNLVALVRRRSERTVAA